MSRGSELRSENHVESLVRGPVQAMLRVLAACHKSQFICRFIHASGDVTRDRSFPRGRSVRCFVGPPLRLLRSHSLSTLASLLKSRSNVPSGR